jgi:predicted RNA-binding protein YlxR (DUF448 family)
MAIAAETTKQPEPPVRRCIVSGAREPVDRLVRFVVGPDGEIVPDVAAKLPGRGLWLRADRDMISAASVGDAFSRSARRRVSVPADLADRVERSLKRHCLGLIGLARRSGQLLVGYEKVRAALASGRVGALLEARDGAAGGRSKVTGRAPEVPVVELFDAGEIGAAVGREHVVHAAVLRGRLAERILAEAARIAAVVADTARDGTDEGTETQEQAGQAANRTL